MIEICCGSFEDAWNAYLGGAKQIELNSALHLGGLTPSIGSLLLTKQNTNLKVICMVRPRGAGFCYSDIEFKQMLLDAEILLDNGADGLAFGFLTENHTIDEKRTNEMVSLIKKHGKEAVFHRAFDCVKDVDASMRILIDLKIDRVLTSGLQEKAIVGKECIKHLHNTYGNQIEILAGSGINRTNMKQLMLDTGINQVHSSCKDWHLDVTTTGNHVSYSYGGEAHVNDYDYVSTKLVEELIAL